jgi:hypothetical protein
MSNAYNNPCCSSGHQTLTLEASASRNQTRILSVVELEHMIQSSEEGQKVLGLRGATCKGDGEGSSRSIAEVDGHTSATAAASLCGRDGTLR